MASTVTSILSIHHGEDNVLVSVVFGALLEDRLKDNARPAEATPEINDDTLVRGNHLLEVVQVLDVNYGALLLRGCRGRCFFLRGRRAHLGVRVALSLLPVTCVLRRKVLSCHRVVHFVGAGESCTLLEIRVEKVSAMATARYTIFDGERDHNSESSRFAIRNILTAVAHKFTELAESSAHACTIRAVMTFQSFGTYIIAVELRWFHESIIPANSTDRSDIIQIVDGLVYCSHTLFSLKVDLARLFVDHPIIVGHPGFQMRNEPLGVGSNSTCDFYKFPVHRAHEQLLIFTK
jgi:hypothetical protein